MCILVIDGRPVLVAYTSAENAANVPSAKNKRRKNKKVSKPVVEIKTEELPVDEEAIEKRIEAIPMVCSGNRSKIAINEDQKFDRRERNRARRKIVIGKRTACQVTKYNLEKDAVVTTTEMLPDDSYLVTVSHRSVGLHGGKPRYKNHRLEAIGKAGELRAKYKRPIITL